MILLAILLPNGHQLRHLTTGAIFFFPTPEKNQETLPLLSGPQENTSFSYLVLTAAVKEEGLGKGSSD